MQLEVLKVFCDIADLRSFSKAAEANQRTQSAVSRMLQELENRLEVQLIDRSTRSLPLTPLGQVYYEGCKRLLDQFLELEASIRHARSEMELTVRVAAIYSVGLGDIRQYVERFEREHSHIKVRIDYLHPDQVYENVHGGKADFGLVSYPRASRELTILPWREEEMVVACAPTHRLAKLSEVIPIQIDGEAYVAFDRGLVIRQEVDRFLRRHSVTVRVVHEFDNIENIKKGIEIGAGLALLPEPMLRQEVQAGSLRAVRLAGCQLRRPLGIIHRRTHGLSHSALAFIELLRANGEAPPLSSSSKSSHVRQSKRPGKRKVP